MKEAVSRRGGNTLIVMAGEVEDGRRQRWRRQVEAEVETAAQ